MNREEEITKASLDFSPCFEYRREIFIKGAEWADSHPANPWHKVASGDLPKKLKGNAENIPFIVKTKGGNQHIAYYASWLDEEYRAIRHDFFDYGGCLLDVEYWMEIPELPK